MVTSTGQKVRPMSATESDLDRAALKHPTSNMRPTINSDNTSNNSFAFIVFALAVIVGGYFFYTYEWPTTSTTPAMTKTDVAPAVTAPATPVAPSALGTATPPATSTTP